MKFETNVRASLNDLSPRLIHIKMFRNVNREASMKAWTYYLVANCEASFSNDSQSLKLALQDFQALVPGTRTGNSQTFVFKNSNAEWFLNKNKLLTFRDKEFTKA
jgi:hypothetical protein